MIIWNEIGNFSINKKITPKLMNKKIKYIGLFAILPMFVAAFPFVAAEEGAIVELVEVRPLIGGQANEYLAIIKVYAGDNGLTNVNLLVESDMATVETMIDDDSNGARGNTGRIFENTYAIKTVKIKAFDPDSVKVELLSFVVPAPIPPGLS